jgi:hypothetical protein
MRDARCLLGRDSAFDPGRPRQWFLHGRPASAQQAALYAALAPALRAHALEGVPLRHWLAIEEPLAVFAADGAEQAHVLVGLDALRHYLLAELVRQCHDRAQDDRACAILTAGMQERAVDLDGVEGELIEIGQRGITSTEVVER